MRAISILSFEEGTSTLGSLARTPFRIRAIMSATGSVMFIGNSSGLPARLDYAGHVARQRLLAETDPAELEFPQVSPRTAARAAAVVLAHGELRRPRRLRDQRRLRHYRPSCCVRNGIPRCRRRSWLSSSVRAEVTNVTFMPPIFSTFA